MTTLSKRKKGLGTQLLEKIFLHLNTHGLEKELWMTVDVENAASSSLMKKCLDQQHVCSYDLHNYAETTYITFVRKKEGSPLELPLTDEQSEIVSSFVGAPQEAEKKEAVKRLSEERTAATAEENTRLWTNYQQKQQAILMQQMATRPIQCATQ